MDTGTVGSFVAVAEERHFGRAAARLHLVQSSVSAAVARLEQELGARLLDRSPRGVRLTDAGAAVLPEARAFLEAAERVRAAAVGERGLAGTVRLGTFAALRVLDLPGAIADFSERHPAVDVRVSTSSTGSTGLAADLKAGRLDAALLALPMEMMRGLELHRLAEFDLVALVPAGDPLAARTALTLRDLAARDFVDAPPGFGHRVLLEQLLAAEGLVRSVRTEAPDLPSVGSFTAAGLGVAVVPSELVPETPGLARVPFEPRTTWPLFLATGPAPTLATRALVAALRSAGG